MRSVIVVCAGLVLGLSGCGSADETTGEPIQASATPRGGGCMSFSPESLVKVGSADLDGDGTPEDVMRVDEDSCHLLVGRNHTSPLETTPLDLAEDATFQTVTLPGTARQLLLVQGAAHPRGGYQPYLIGEADEVLGTVEFKGRPLLPFVATDGGALPSTARCNASGGIDLVSTEVSEDAAGLTERYDVSTTSYEIVGNIANAVANTSEMGLDRATLEAGQPDLFEPGKLLTGCVAG